MKKIKEFMKKENTINIIILLIASIFICLPLLNKNIDVYYDDGIQHIARLIGTYQSIKEGQTFPNIMSNLCNKFGYSWNIFYSPFTAYVPLIFKIFGMSFIACLKLFMFAMVFASSVAMYFFTKEVTKNKKIALLAGIFYIFAPYRFTDMYSRNALAELASFTFLPMVFHGLYGVLKRKPKREYLLIIGSSLLILTHTVIAMYTAIFCFVYLVTKIRKFKDKKILIKLATSLLFIVIITSFFWGPLLEHKLSASYEVFKPGRMERTEVLIAYKLGFLELFFTPKDNYMTYEIGLLSVILLVFTPTVIKNLKEKYNKTSFYNFYIFALVSGLVSVVMSLKIFPFEHLPALLKMLQFSFRMLEFSSFFFAFVTSVNFATLITKFNKKSNKKIIKNSRLKENKAKVRYLDVTVVLVILMLLSLTFTNHLQYKENMDIAKLEEGVRVTKDTGRVHAGCASFEYLPCKAFENRSYIENRTDEVIALEGNAEISDMQKQGTNLNCKIQNAEDGTVVELPYIYYLGYNVVIEENKKSANLQTFETENGFVGVKLPETQNGTLSAHYEGTNLMKVTYATSILGIILILGCLLKERYLSKIKSKNVKK